MNVILDTNILIQLKTPSSPGTNGLLKLVEFRQIQLFIPLLALDELEQSVVNGLRDMAKEVDRARDKAKLWTAGTSLGRSAVVTDSELIAMAKNRRLEWEQLIADGRAMPLPYPPVGHSRLVRRCLEGRRPFLPNKDDEGYRDALLWESALDLVTSTKDQTILISNDKTAFFGEELSNLHSDLDHELSESGVESGRFYYFVTVREFMDSMFGETTPLDHRIFDETSQARISVGRLIAVQAQNELSHRSLPAAVSRGAIAGIDLVIEAIDQGFGIRFSTAATRSTGDHSLSGDLLVDCTISYRPIPAVGGSENNPSASWILDGDEATDYQRTILALGSSRMSRRGTVSVNFFVVLDPELKYIKESEFEPIYVDNESVRD